MVNHTVTLNTLPEGQRASVRSIRTTGAMRRRLQDIGLVEGTPVVCLQRSPFGDPVAYQIRGAAIALRTEDSKDIEVQMS